AATATVSFRITAPAPKGGGDVRVTPVNVAPPAVMGDSNEPLRFAGKHRVQVRAAHLGTGAVRVRLTVGHGALHLHRAPGLHLSGDGTGALTLTGKLAAVNRALAGLVLMPGTGFAGKTRLKMATSV